jgi:hypothetical protein
MSSTKVHAVLLAFNVVGFAKGCMLHAIGLQWLVPIIP